MDMHESFILSPCNMQRDNHDYLQRCSLMSQHKCVLFKLDKFNSSQ